MRRGFSVALLGGDGAGKTTVGRRLTDDLGDRVAYVYMGVNPSASNHQLPTTRIVNRLRGRTTGRNPSAEPDVGDAPRRRRGGMRELVRTATTPLRLAHRLTEEWYRQLVAWRLMAAGRIVLYDRHFFFDYHATDIDRRRRDRSLSRRVHGYVLEHLYPRPDLVIYLDAPPEVLFARKGEGTLESLATRRAEYRAFREDVAHYLEVDASQPLEAVIARVVAAVEHFDRHRTLVDLGGV